MIAQLQRIPQRRGSTHARHVQVMPVREGEEETPTDGTGGSGTTVALLPAPADVPVTAIA